MTELGARLKEARLAKGYSLEDLQEVTKIQKRYLVGIEEGNYSIMPGSFYVRAFIKQYAEAVGLNAEDLLEEYKRDIPGTQTQEVVHSFSKSPSRRKLKSASSNKTMEAMPKLIVALFVIVIIVFIWVLSLQKANDTSPIVETGDAELEYEQKPTTKPADKEEKPVEKEPVKEEEPVVKQAISAGAVAGEDTTFEVKGSETLKIRVEVAGDTWVGIRNEAQAEQVTAKAYKAGEVVEHDSTANGYARIRLGNSKVAKVFVNDEEVTYAQDRVTQNIILKLIKEEQ